MQRITKMFTVSLVLMALILLSGCGSKAPECSGEDTTDLVKQIAKKNDLFKSFIYDSSAPPKIVILTNELKASAEYKKIVKFRSEANALWGKYKRKCLNKFNDGRCYWAGKICQGDDVEYYAYYYKKQKAICGKVKAYYYENILPNINTHFETSEMLAEMENNITKNVKNDFTKNFKNITYTLENIVTTSKNDEFQNSSCKAKITGMVPNWEGAEKEIKYKLEKTDDGKLLATVYQ